MNPTASTQSLSALFGDRIEIAMNQIVEMMPKAIVETSGVLCSGCTRPKIFGIDPQRAIDSVVRAVGRIVVCVDAGVEVRIRLSGLGNTCGPKNAKMSPALLPSAAGPA